MHPTLAAGFAALAWLFVHHWSLMARVLLALAVFLLAWEPASSGTWYGILLMSIAAGVAASVLWDDLRGRQPVPRGRTARPAGPGAVDPLSPEHRRRAASPEDPGLYRVDLPPAMTGPSLRHGRAVPPDVLTELERAEWYGDLLDVNIAGYEDAKRNGDLRAQAAFAGEIEDLASEMREMLRVVLGERHRVAN